MPLLPRTSDTTLTEVTSRFAGLAAVVLRDPERWLGWGVGRLLGGVHPGTPGWDLLGPAERSGWWVRRLSTLGSAVAATPRIAGAVADRFPLQAAMATTVQGLTVCAVAREHGVRDPDDWVPLLGTVLFDRRLARSDSAAAARVDGGPEQVLASAGDVPPVRGPLRRAATTTVRLGRVLLSVPGMFDERPRGSRVFRVLGKVPLLGLPAGFLDERGAVRRAAARTTRELARAG